MYPPIVIPPKMKMSEYRSQTWSIKSPCFDSLFELRAKHPSRASKSALHAIVTIATGSTFTQNAAPATIAEMSESKLS
jgi:hypothetical protein